MLPVAVRGDPNVAAGQQSVAADTDALIVERIPFPPGVGGAQDREVFVGWELDIQRKATTVLIERVGTS